MKHLLLLVALLASHHARAETVEDTFSRLFYESYRPRHCGLNIAELVTELAQQKINLQGFRVVKIDNYGSSGFGMINAEHVRDIEEVTERNWYFHVILIGPDEEVYDPSFGMKPTTVSLPEYLETMFLNEEECGRSVRFSELCIGRKTKLREYRMTWFDANDYIQKSEPYRVDFMKDHI